MNYAALKTAIAGFLHRNDLTSMIPTFIEMAEARFNRELRSSEQEETAITDATTEFTTLPDDFLQLRMMYSGNRKLTYYPPERLQQMIDVSYVPQIPVYSIQDKQFRLYPTPTTENPTPLRILYWSKITPLSDTETTNWLLEKHPDLYLFASLLEARGFVKADSQMAMWEARVDKTLAQLRRHSAYMLSGPAMTVRAVA